MKEEVKDVILKLGASVCGVANIERFKEAPKGFSPIDIWDKCKSVIVYGIALPKGLTEVESRLIYGNLLTIGAILTSLELPSDKLCEEMCLPGCKKCIESCLDL